MEEHVAQATSQDNGRRLHRVERRLKKRLGSLGEGQKATGRVSLSTSDCGVPVSVSFGELACTFDGLRNGDSTNWQLPSTARLLAPTANVATRAAATGVAAAVRNTTRPPASTADVATRAAATGVATGGRRSSMSNKHQSRSMRKDIL